MFCYYCMKETNAEGESCPICGKPFAADENRCHLAPGTVLKEKYLIGHVLGQGGFGITYAGKDTTLDIKIAVKEYYPQGHASRDCQTTNNVTLLTGPNEQYFANGKERFLTEAKTLAKFNRESNIVNVRDYFELNGTAYIIMDYVEGDDLKHYLRAHGKMDAQEVVDWFLPILRVLAKVHAEGLIHRDISPDNIIIEDDELILIDFGAARDLEISKSLSVMLKPGYAPGEQYCSDSTKQGPWTDIYAVCATMYECITGVVPQESSSRLFEDKLQKPSDLGIVLPSTIELALMKGLNNRSEDRQQTMQELIDDLTGKTVLMQPDYQPTVLMGGAAADELKKSLQEAESQKSAAAKSAQVNSAPVNSAPVITAAGGDLQQPQQVVTVIHQESAASKKLLFVVIAACMAIVLMGGGIAYAIVNANRPGLTGENSISSASPDADSTDAPDSEERNSISETEAETDAAKDSKASTDAASGADSDAEETTTTDKQKNDKNKDSESESDSEEDPEPVFTQRSKRSDNSGNHSDPDPEPEPEPEPTKPVTTKKPETTKPKPVTTEAPKTDPPQTDPPKPNPKSDTFKLDYNGETITITGLKREVETLDIPSEIDGVAVTAIGENAFENCGCILEVFIPDSIEKIGKYAFKGSGTEYLHLPDSMYKIDEYAFYGMEFIQKVIIPDSVEYINAWAFGQCENLEKICIPSSVIEIGVSAFRCEPSTGGKIYYAASSSMWKSIDISDTAFLGFDLQNDVVYNEHDFGVV